MRTRRKGTWISAIELIGYGYGQSHSKHLALTIVLSPLPHFRSSDSNKYSTNKSSGASVTSNHQMKHHHISSITHDPSVSNRKPPMHPNHYKLSYNNHKTSSIPVHTANNRLFSNTVFHNNHYTFSLDRNGDGGYLESRPLSASSLYGDGQRVSRGTKSDIDVPCRRQSTTTRAQLHNSSVNKTKLPSVKSDFFLSYLNNNNNAGGGGRTSSDTANTSAFFISDGSTSNYLDLFKSDAKPMYSSSKTGQQSDFRTNRSTATGTGTGIATKYTNRTNNFTKQSNNANSNVGPLLYLDSFDPFSDKSTFSNAHYQSIESVSKPFNAWNT